MKAASARQLLIDWANSEENWVRAIVRDALATRQPIPEAALKDVYGVCLAEKELVQGPVTSVPDLAADPQGEGGIDKLTLSSLHDVKGVNRLAPNQRIEFNPRMTVLFGENATGKSGYVRVLKRVAAVRSAEEVLPDVHAKGAQGSPSATLGYKLGETNGTHVWTGAAGETPFTRISVFDTRAMTFHLDEELTYVYTPRDLALFQFVHQGIQKISAWLETDRDQARPKSNPFLVRFQKGSVVYPKIETLSTATDLSELEKLSEVQEDEAGHLTNLRETVEALKSNVISSRAEVARGDRELYASIAGIAELVAGFDSVRYQAARNQFVQSEKLYKAATQTAFAGVDIPGLLSDAWQVFIQAADAHWKDIGRPNYPQTDDKCIYCQQALGSAAINLLQKYRDYCNSALKTELDQARNELETVGFPIARLDVAAIQERTRNKIAAAGGAIPKVAQTSIPFLEELAPIISAVQRGESIQTTSVAAAAVELRQMAKEAEAEATSLDKTLQKQGEQRQRELSEQAAKLRNLEDRLTLNELLPQIGSHLTNAKWAQRADTIVRNRFPALLRSLTTQAKVASEDLLNQDFERLFREECHSLMAPEVQLHFPGRRGEAARRKSISADHRLSEILSEGEQKVIALSDFLAESAIRAGSAPVLFDDPVNSLDYKRLDYVVQRLYALSSVHQVIVFTHNIWFATGLLAKFESAPDQCAYFDVEGGSQQFGLITGGNHPRWDVPNKLKGQINDVIQAAEKATGEAQRALVERGYSQLRSWCEAVVEQEILCSVTRRYQPNVMMTNLRKIKADRLEAAIDLITKCFEKACRVTDAHSQPLETLGVHPTLQDLKTDWKEAQAARDAYIVK